MDSVDHGVGRREGGSLSSVPSGFGNAGTQKNRAPVLPPRFFEAAC
jgi:hypothetical protein